MQQAAVLDCLSFDPFSLHEDCLAAPEVDVGGRKVADALVVAKVIVVGDEGADLSLKVAGQIVVLEQDAVLQRLMPAFDFALCLRMVGRAANVPHVLCIEPLSQIRRDVTGTIIAEQAWLMDDPCLVTA